METLSLQRVTLPQALAKSVFIREHMKENVKGHSRDLLFCGKYSVKITT